jgi:hypothetical protein
MKRSVAIEVEPDARTPAAERADADVVTDGAPANPRPRPSANFVAHIAATFLGVPQTRPRRRRDPNL